MFKKIKIELKMKNQIKILAGIALILALEGCVKVFAFYILTLLICIPRIVTHRAFLRALLELPSTFISMILALVGIGTADKRFIHTSHSNTDVENIFHRRKK
jgi:hypothetical protein